MFLNFKIQGEGHPILLIHGLFGNLDNLNQIAKFFISDRQVIQIDLPNHGLSDRLAEFDYSILAESIAVFLKNQGIEKIDIVGHSMGGKVAMALALCFPELVRQIVVLDIAPVTYIEHRHQNVFAGLNASLMNPSTDRKMAEKDLAQHILDPSVRQFLLKSFSRNADQSYSWSFDIQNLENNYSAIMGWDLKGQFNGPTLFIKGEQSDYIIDEHRVAILKFFPKAKAHIVAGTGHWLHVEKPETIVRIIQRFLNHEVR